MKRTIAYLALAAAAAAPVAQAETIRWKLAETWPPNFPIFGDAVKNMAKSVKEMSNGRLLITIDSKNKHKAPFGILDMVQSAPRGNDPVPTWPTPCSRSTSNPYHLLPGGVGEWNLATSSLLVMSIWMGPSVLEPGRALKGADRLCS